MSFKHKKKEIVIRFRAWEEQRAAWEAAARAQGRSLSEWVRVILDAGAKRQGGGIRTVNRTAGINTAPESNNLDW